MTLPGGNTVQTSYASSSIVTMTDQVNRKIKRETDGLGRLIKVTEQDSTGALTQETTYTYNLLEKLTGVNQGGQLRSYKYDAMGRLLFEKIPEQTATINDGTGTMWSSKYTYTEYDALHRRTGTVYNTAGAPGVAATDNVAFLYDSDGQSSAPGLMRVTMGAVEERYTYDDFGRVSSVTESITPFSVPRPYTTSYQYNGGSQLSKMIYPSGKDVDVSYDDKGRFREMYGIVSGVTYNLAGQVSGLQMTPGGAVSQSYGYDAHRLQLTTQTATKGATSLMNLTYGYQASAGQMGAGSTAGNASQLMSISGTINSTTESAAYTYDNLGRLVTSNQTSNGASAQRRFAYDRWGNRTGVWDAISGGNQIQSITLQQSGGAPTNRLASITSGSTVNYTYDAAGNVTNDGVHG